MNKTEAQMMAEIRDITGTDAEVMAQNIRDYWAKRGKHVRVWIESVGFDKSYLRCVRSDMMDGLPK